MNSEIKALMEKDARIRALKAELAAALAEVKALKAQLKAGQ